MQIIEVRCKACGWPTRDGKCSCMEDWKKVGADAYEEHNVSRPPHYQTGDLETIDFIRAKLSAVEFRGYCKGNALKYLSREARKGGDIDLKKAIWYLRTSVGDDPRAD